MSTNFPTSVDALTNPTGTDPLSSPSHSAQHTNANDALEAIQTALVNHGIGTTDLRAATILSTASTTFVDVTGAYVTVTTYARRCLVTVVATGYNNTAAQDVYLDMKVDTVRVGGTDGLVGCTQIAGSADIHNLSFSFITDALTAAAHTFQLAMRVTGGTGNVFNSAAKPLRISVKELL